MIFAVPSVVGYILNILPVYLAKNTADKKVKKKEFYDSTNIGAGSILGAIYFVLLFLILLPFFGFDIAAYDLMDEKIRELITLIVFRGAILSTFVQKNKFFKFFF